MSIVESMTPQKLNRYVRFLNDNDGPFMWGPIPYALWEQQEYGVGNYE